MKTFNEYCEVRIVNSLAENLLTGEVSWEEFRDCLYDCYRFNYNENEIYNEFLGLGPAASAGLKTAGSAVASPFKAAASGLWQGAKNLGSNMAQGVKNWGSNVAQNYNQQVNIETISGALKNLEALRQSFVAMKTSHPQLEKVFDQLKMYLDNFLENAKQNKTARLGQKGVGLGFRQPGTSQPDMTSKMSQFGGGGSTPMGS